MKQALFGPWYPRAREAPRCRKRYKLHLIANVETKDIACKVTQGLKPGAFEIWVNGCIPTARIDHVQPSPLGIQRRREAGDGSHAVAVQFAYEKAECVTVTSFSRDRRMG